MPEEKVEKIDSTWVNYDRGVVLSKLTELPELEPENDELNGNKNGNFRFSSFRGSRGRGNFGGRDRNHGDFGGGSRGGRGNFFRGRGGRGFNQVSGRGMKRRLDFDSGSHGPVKRMK